ncbi:efflux RND transporter periplasmic adaptor subunit [Cellvibrio japonicus]|uniref:Cation efflux system protein n=1 Tax=Cellvibrio japonicus (strain Ueda107) TaxID=498211 RepID=B3PHV3_CELJU|nr:HlyD family efflux transporter periplasmic adaptor subunit [Cellvibrio japonicus]ACE83814.1 cation efflux system protein [Cellvibrio japonicus Ueda107]QEI13891.1 HlyD family efflux transporter periplasmic adaptor subunit [Cellvibrio japonicus]QEI17465.1 HlyD family efflux transporter periplasmic adaptor subunit [Cellvibrio japonicus]QEI21041.1 HlyD family efflux transporter periplasmic adaptor subunit [Cellvibrio japonicus]
MKYSPLFSLLLSFSLPAVQPLWAAADHDHGSEEAHNHGKSSHDRAAGHSHGDDDDDHDHEEEPTQVQLTPEVAEASALTTAVAEAGVLQKRVKLYGSLEVDPQRISHIQARYPGLIRQVNPVIGSPVNAGDVLARVESNESLRDYPLVSPIKGRVVERHANPGEYAGDQVLFTVLDESVLELHLRVFPGDVGKIKPGQTITLDGNGHLQQTRIDFITPRLGDSPTLEVHAAIDNSAGQWVPNQAVEAWVSIAETPVALRLDNRALQVVREQTLVFVRDLDSVTGKVRYDSRPVKLGRSDGLFSEVLEGLHAGDEYVVENAYLLKADLEKSGAGHEH